MRGLAIVRPTAPHQAGPSTSQAPEPAHPILRIPSIAPQPGSSRDPLAIMVNIGNQRPGPSHELGNLSRTGRLITQQPDGGMTTRYSQRYDPIHSNQMGRRVRLPPTYWRPDLQNESNSEDDLSDTQQASDTEERIFPPTARIPLPISIVRPPRSVNRGGRRNMGNEPLLSHLVRPRRETSPLVGEQDFVPSGYFPNPAMLAGNSRRHNPEAHTTEREVNPESNLQVQSTQPISTNTDEPTSTHQGRPITLSEYVEIHTNDSSGITRQEPLHHETSVQNETPSTSNEPSASIMTASTSTGKQFRRRHPSVGKCPRNLLENKDLSLELRENLRELIQARRKSARYERRDISSDDSDDSDEGDESCSLSDSSSSDGQSDSGRSLESHSAGESQSGSDQEDVKPSLKRKRSSDDSDDELVTTKRQKRDEIREDNSPQDVQRSDLTMATTSNAVIVTVEENEPVDASPRYYTRYQKRKRNTDNDDIMLHPQTQMIVPGPSVDAFNVFVGGGQCKNKTKTRSRLKA